MPGVEGSASSTFLCSFHARPLPLGLLLFPFTERKSEAWQGSVFSKAKVSDNMRHLTRRQLVLLTHLPKVHTQNISTNVIVKSPRCQNTPWRLWWSSASVSDNSVLSFASSPHGQALNRSISFRAKTLHSQVVEQEPGSEVPSDRRNTFLKRKLAASFFYHCQSKMSQT